ncbi:MAG: helix-hairpin-helix domain-containing protein [Betaproteobacteria bacterium]|nr:helix-hairpin-helix domain-containing protein [Betaproteobacteria bacterium]
MRDLIGACLLACASWANAHTLELAQARELDLDGLRGLGPATTQRILAERARAPFRDWADLMQRVPGIGARKAAQLSAQGLRINGQSHPDSVQPSR